MLFILAMMNRRTKSSLHNIILMIVIMVLVDLLTILIFQSTQEYPSDAMTVGFIILPGIVVINLVTALVLHFLKHRVLSRLALVNCILAPIIYVRLDIAHYERFTREHYDVYTFTNKHHKFEIVVAKATPDYSFTDVTNQPNGSTTGFIGDYKLKGDSIILIDSTRHPIIVGLKLLGYPTSRDVILLNKIGQ